MLEEIRATLPPERPKITPSPTMNKPSKAVKQLIQADATWKQRYNFLIVPLNSVTWKSKMEDNLKTFTFSYNVVSIFLSPISLHA
jgi:hypothetical protein